KFDETNKTKKDLRIKWCRHLFCKCRFLVPFFKRRFLVPFFKRRFLEYRFSRTPFFTDALHAKYLLVI
ncbi:MAG: hypothetical protein WB014_10255, partial [Methanosarcina sp.]